MMKDGRIVTIGKIIDMIVTNFNVALNTKSIRKPLSWALYQTWKWVDHNEKSRFSAEGTCTEVIKRSFNSQLEGLDLENPIHEQK